MLIQEARGRDAAEIHDLYKEVMQYDYPIDKMEKMIEFVYKDLDNYVFIAKEQDKIVGVMEIVIKYSIHKPSYLIINCLAVAMHYQGKGVGTQLVQYVDHFAKQRGLGSIQVGSQFKRLQAHHFYKKNGFQEIKEHKIFQKSCQ